MMSNFPCNYTNISKKCQNLIISNKRCLNRIKLGYVSAWALGFTLWTLSFFLIKKWQPLLIKRPLSSQQDNADGRLAVEDANSSAPAVEVNNSPHSHAMDSEIEDTHSPASAVEGLKEHTTALRENGDDKSLLVFPLTFLLFVIVKDAWLSDDSYITMRVVDNFIRGYGLTWNIDERV